MPELEEKTRMSLSITTLLHNRIADKIPWGIRSRFIEKLLEIAMDRVDKGGDVVLGAILLGKYDPFQKGGD